MTLLSDETDDAINNDGMGGPARIRSGAISQMSAIQRRGQVIRAETIAGIHTDTHVGDRWDRRWRGVEAFQIAAEFDPLNNTAQHCAALLYFLDWSDAKWLYSAGISMDVVQIIGAAAAAFEAKHGACPPLTDLAGRAGPAPEKCDLDEWWGMRLAFFHDVLAHS